MPQALNETAPEAAAKGCRTLRLAGVELRLDGEQLGYLHDAPAPRGDPAALRRAMADDGYLLLRGLLPLERIQAARRAVLEHLDRAGKVDRSFPLMDGIIAPNAGGEYIGGKKEVTHAPDFLSLVECPELFAFFERYFGERAMSFSYKWLRAVANGAGTKAHYDVVFMGRGATENLFTCWIPAGDVSFDEGPLAVLTGSHNLESYRRIRETYGKADVDKENIDSNFSHDPLEIVKRFGGQWQTTEFKAGDVLIFGMYTMHAAIENVSRKFRISTDVRFQPASAPVDERWVGENPIANYGWRKTEPVPIEVSRKQWGV
jgi:hypothetical protein